MKLRSRLQALLLALTMVVTFMPSLAFAEGGSDAQSDNDLSHYEIRVNDIKDGDWRVFTDTTTDISLNVDVVLRNNEDVIADADEYELKIIRETYTETDFYEDECVNGQISLDENGTFSGRLFAAAKNGSGLTGETEAVYVDIFHNKTLYPFGPDVSFDPDHMTNGSLPMTDYYLYSTSDSGVAPEVKIDGTVLTEDTDFTVRYRKEDSDETADSFPAEPGTYQCMISAIANNPGGYYGNNDSVWLIITASEDYEQTKKDHDDAQSVMDMINDFDFTDPDASKTKAARTAYDALSPAAKAIITEREYGRLQVAEFVLLMKKVDPAAPSSADVKEARAKYDSFCDLGKTTFLEMACEKQGDLSAKLESAEKKLKEIADKQEAERKKKEAAVAEAAEWKGVLNTKIPVVQKLKVKAGKKKVTVSWKKATAKKLKKFDKVEIQVCPNKKFKKENTKRVIVKKSKKSAVIKKLNSKKTYYVRVRNVKGNGVKKQVSKWTKVKKIKIK